MKFIDDKKVGLRLKELIGEDSVRNVAIQADIDPSQFAKIVRGNLPITENILEKLVKTFKWNADFILYGSGKNVPRETRKQTIGITHSDEHEGLL